MMPQITHSKDLYWADDGEQKRSQVEGIRNLSHSHIHKLNNYYKCFLKRRSGARRAYIRGKWKSRMVSLRKWQVKQKYDMNNERKRSLR